MNSRSDLPAVADVRLAIKDLAGETGRPPTALAVARRLGLPNTTFRRNYPDITAELRLRSASTASGPLRDPAARFDQIRGENEKLRRANRELSEHLELAIAHIQRLTVDNHRLLQQLELASNVTRLSVVTDT